MEKRARQIVVENVRRAMAIRGIDSEVALSRLAKVDQKTINNLMSPERFLGSPLMETVEKIADALDIPLWHLFMPDIPADLLTSRTMDKIMECYTQVGAEGRQEILRVSEAEVRYSATAKAGNHK